MPCRLSRPVTVSTSARSKRCRRSAAAPESETSPDGKHEADASAAPRELQRALDKQLVAVDVRARLDAVDAGLADEIGQPPRVVTASLRARATSPLSPRTMSHGGLPRTASKPGLPRGGATFVREDLRKGERPVKKALARGHGLGAPGQRRPDALGQGRAAVPERCCRPRRTRRGRERRRRPRTIRRTRSRARGTTNEGAPPERRARPGPAPCGARSRLRRPARG